MRIHIVEHSLTLLEVIMKGVYGTCKRYLCVYCKASRFYILSCRYGSVLDTVRMLIMEDATGTRASRQFNHSLHVNLVHGKFYAREVSCN